MVEALPFYGEYMSVEERGNAGLVLSSRFQGVRVVSVAGRAGKKFLSSRACLLPVSRGHRGDEADWL